jgi:hypothetical protein
MALPGIVFRYNIFNFVIDIWYVFLLFFILISFPKFQKGEADEWFSASS